MNNSNNPLSTENITAGIIITVVGGLILALIIQDARFSPNQNPVQPIPITQIFVTQASDTQEDIQETASNNMVPTPKSNILTQTKQSEPSSILPRFFGFRACLSACTSNSNNFPKEVPAIEIHWSYENVPKGSRYERIWTLDGFEWIKYICNWPVPESGASTVNLQEPYGLHSGEWQMEIRIDGETYLQESVFVEGNYDYWDPAGTIYSCFGLAP